MPAGKIPVKIRARKTGTGGRCCGIGEAESVGLSLLSPADPTCEFDSRPRRRNNNHREPSMDDVLRAARSVRMDPARIEEDVVSALKEALLGHGIPFDSEVIIAPHCRVDILVSGGIAIEVKKGKPNSRGVAAQVKRYARSPVVNAVVLVTERGLGYHVHEAHGKRVEYVAVSSNWGLAT